MQTDRLPKWFLVLHFAAKKIFDSSMIMQKDRVDSSRLFWGWIRTHKINSLVHPPAHTLHTGWSSCSASAPGPRSWSPNTVFIQPTEQPSKRTTIRSK